IGKALTWWNSQVQTRGREAAVGMTWEDFKALMKEEYCPSNEMQKLETDFWSHAMVGAGHAAYTDRFHELARLVPHLVTPETKRIERYIYGLATQIYRMVASTKPPTIQNVILKDKVLTDKVVRNGSLKKSGEKIENGREPSKEWNVKGDNKRARTGKVLSIITNPVRNEYMSSAPKCINYNFHHYPETSCHACTNYKRLGHFAKNCRAGPKMVNPLNTRNPTTGHRACYEFGGTDHYKSACPRLNRAQRQGGNHPNQALAIEGGQGRRNNGNPACGRAFVIGGKEAYQDPNIMTGTFSINKHYATMLFDFGSDYSFVSTTFMPLLYIKPSSLGFSHEIEIANGELVEVNKVIHGCKLEIEGHTFDIDLTLFRHGSFDVIIGMDWLSRIKGEAFHECKSRRATGRHRHHLNLLRVEQVDHQELLSPLENRRPIRSTARIIILLQDRPSVRIPSVTKKEHEMHLGSILNLLKKEKLYAKFSKCEFWLQEVQFLGHVVNNDDIHVDPSNIEVVKNWETPKSPMETFKDKLCNATVLALPDRPEDFMVYCDASCQGLGWVLMQRGKVITYASRQLKIYEKNYTTHDLELGVVVFALKIWRHYLYGMKSVTYTDYKSLQHIFDQEELNMHQRP
ncbi:putative reverse transcriptase domain-containing protein, partial [Tanacetum coccineum]